ncbi:MAG: hypothetical protein AAGH60_05100 [Pseudomonadota bacterium]
MAYDCPQLNEQEFQLQFGELPFLQGEAGWFYRKRDLNMMFALSDSVITTLSRIDQILRSRGTQLLMLPMPSKALMIPEYLPADGIMGPYFFDDALARSEAVAMLQSIEDAGINVVDLVDHARRKLTDDERFRFFFQRDHHWRPEGASFAAEITAQWIRQFPSYAELEKTDYATNRVEEGQVFNSNMALIIEQMCGETPAPEQIDVFQTAAENQAASAFLVDDSADGRPHIHILGSSFMNESSPYNFAGFLREFTQLDVATFAVPGGQADQAIYRWSHDGRHIHSPPHFVVWEMPFMRVLNSRQDVLRRQILPAIAGACDGDAVEVLTHDGGAELRLALSSPGVRGDRFYLAARLQNSAPAEFLITLEFADGYAERSVIRRPNRIGPVNQLFFSLPEDAAADLARVLISAPGTEIEGWDLYVCSFPDFASH